MKPLLCAKSVSKSYGLSSLFRRRPSRHVLADVDLEIAAGESLAVLGRSGSGKSTLARLLLGLESPSAGTIAFEGMDIAAMASETARAYRRSVQIVFQDSIGAVNPRRTIEWIVAEPLRHLTDLSVEERAKRVAELLVAVELDPTDASKLPSQMSGGQLQRVCLARALATKPRVLILDEAVSNLDIQLQGQIIGMMRAIRGATGMAIVFITHDVRLVRMLCDRVVVMASGRIVESRAVGRSLALDSEEGRMLQDAVLPRLPAGLA